MEHKEDCELGEIGDEGNLKGCYGQTHSGSPMNCFCIIIASFLLSYILRLVTIFGNHVITNTVDDLLS